MMDGIVTQLYKIRDLKVIAGLSEKYRNSNRDVREIGEELNVSMIMTGSVSKVGNDLRISVKLFDAKTGYHRWSDIYSGEYTEDVFSFQDTIAKKVAAALNIAITPREKESIEKITTQNMLAHEFSLKGWDALIKWIYGNDSIFLILADNLFDQALKLDPDYIGALNGKSHLYREASKFDSALYFCDKILKIDPNNRYGFHGKGTIYMYMGRTDSALKYLQKAIEIAPNDPWINLALGQTMLSRNDAIKALSYMQKAYDLGGDIEPEISNGISMVFFNIGEYEKAKKWIKRGLSLRSECSMFMDYWYIYYAQGKYGKVFNEVDSTCNINPCQWNCDIMRFYTYTSLKEFEKAEYHYMKAIEDGFKRTEEADIYLACLYNNTGREKEALSILNKSIKTNESWLSTYSKNESLLSTYNNTLEVKSQLCASYAILGNKKKVIEYLPALETTEYWISHINFKAFPGFDNLRSDPEFVNYVKSREEEKLKIRNQLKEMEKRGEIKL
jgi:tetratricopeptide (TPR) repeat protein